MHRHYSKNHKEFLRELIKQYPIIDNKKNDHKTISEKNQAWEDITRKYNFVTGTVVRIFETI